MGTSSFYSALAGLNTNRTAIDVIGNNLANLNTIGFKKSFTTFSDVLGMAMSGAVNGAGNPMEVGLGSQVAAIDQIFSQGSLRTSGEATDMAIQGAGFFILSGASGRTYSRAGNFSFDATGILVSPTGKTVLGYQADATGTIQSSSLAPINISGQITSSPNPTTEIFMRTILDADATPDSTAGEFTTSIRVFDSLGVAHNISFVFRRYATPTAGAAVSWGFDIRMDATEVDPAGVAGEQYSILTDTIIDPNDPPPTLVDFAGTLDFDATGELIGGNFAASNQGALGAIAAGIDPTGISIPGDTRTLLSGANDIIWSWDLFADDGTGNINSYAMDAGSATSSTSQDGFGVGSLTSILVNPDGTITGLFSNGDVRNLAQVALANFNNPQGLMAIGNNEFLETRGSGQAATGTPDSGGRGSISGSTLELSNVDLAEEFTSLIIAERGFQANSRVIIASNTLLQEAIQLSR